MRYRAQRVTDRRGTRIEIYDEGNPPGQPMLNLTDASARQLRGELDFALSGDPTPSASALPTEDVSIAAAFGERG